MDPLSMVGTEHSPEAPPGGTTDMPPVRSVSEAEGERHRSHESLAPHWSFTVSLIVLAVAFGWHATNTLAYVGEVLVALSAVAASPTLVAFTPSVRHRRRTQPRKEHQHRPHGERLSIALLVLSVICLVLVAVAGLSTTVTVVIIGLVVVLLVATLYHDRAVPVEPSHVEGRSARLSHALHSPAFAGLLLFVGMITSVTLAWW